jgi:hypothetical protein
MFDYSVIFDTHCIAIYAPFEVVRSYFVNMIVQYKYGKYPFVRWDLFESKELLRAEEASRH